MNKLVLIGIILLSAFLRLYKLGSVPPSLYWDEASLGYNAYSILKTARDEHGRFLPATNFAAFGDYKPPGYIYATVPSIALFGLNEFSTRLPSAFFGIITVFISYLLARKLFQNEYPALLSAFFLAISPWHLQFSRGAFEANLGLFFSTLGIYLFIKFKENPIWILPSMLSLLAAMYTFTGQRLFIPFILLILLIDARKQIFANIKIVVISTLISAFLFWPLLIFATSTLEGRLRFEEVNIFKDLEPIDISRRYQNIDNFSWWSQIVHNRRFQYLHEYLIHYFDAFNTSFLFIRGDVNPRLSPQEVGELYLVDLPLILAGVYFLFSKKQKYRWLIIGWILISPLGPAMARETPHALRMIHILPTYQLISAFGLYSLFRLISYKKTFLTITFLLLILNFLFYLHMYYVHWPKNYSQEWQYGYKEAVEVTKSYISQVDSAIITNSLGRPYVYFLFYLQYDPRLYWQTSRVDTDQFRFINVKGFDKFRFTPSPNEIASTGKTLYIVNPGQLPLSAQKITTITRLDNTPVFDIGIIR